MANPTTVIHRSTPTPEQIREQDLREIENALVEHKAAILETLELMSYVQETELLNILKALVSERNEVIDHIVTFVDGSDMTRSLKNALLLFGTLGQLNVEEMEPLIGKLNGVISSVAELGSESGRSTSLLQTLKDPDLIDGLNTALALLKGLGAKPADLKDGVRDQNNRYEEGNNQAKHTNVSTSIPTKWIAVAAASASLFALGVLFKK